MYVQLSQAIFNRRQGHVLANDSFQTHVSCMKGVWLCVVRSCTEEETEEEGVEGGGPRGHEDGRKVSMQVCIVNCISSHSTCWGCFDSLFGWLCYLGKDSFFTSRNGCYQLGFHVHWYYRTLRQGDISSSRNNQSFSILPLFSLLSRLQECNPPSPCDQVRPWAAPQGPCGH